MRKEIDRKMNFENEKLKEFNEYIRFRKVAIIGLGVSNLPLLDYMFEKKARVTVFDEREREKFYAELVSFFNIKQRSTRKNK